MCVREHREDAGQPICKLWLPPHGLHADLNGDGVLDHAVAIGDDKHVHAGHHRHAHLLPCHGYVHSGYPPNTALFNGTICRNRGAAAGGTAAMSMHFGFVDHDTKAPLDTVPPIALRAPTRAAGQYVKDNGAAPAPSLAVFLNSRGDLVAYDGHGMRRWMRQTPASWVNLQQDKAHERVAPTLKPLPFFAHAVPSAVLAAGARQIAMLS